MADIKLKFLKILEILLDTDEQHPITTADIIAKLSLYQMTVEKKAVYRDIEVLKEAGYDILLSEDNKKGYYLATREFEDWETKILLDAVSSAKFLTEKNKTELSGKLLKLASESSQKLLKIVSSIPANVKSVNKTTQYNIDNLLGAIKAGYKISFQYTYVGIDENNKVVHKLRKGGFRYIVNPYALIWQDNYYYLICNYDKYDGLSYYRLDKIMDLKIENKQTENVGKSGIKKITEEPIKVKPLTDILGENATQAMEAYVSRSIYRFSGETIHLQLKVNKEILEQLVDYFGDSINIQKTAHEILVRVDVIDSEGLYYWLLQYGNSITVVEPVQVKQKVIEKAQGILARYE